MRRSLVIALLLCVPALALAKGKKASGSKSKAQAPSTRAIGELMGKFKWGMAPDDVIKIIAAQIHEKYVEPMKATSDVYQQDQLRQKEADEVKQVRDSYVKFDGRKTGWDTSIIDKEFVHRNDESMLVLWEKDQRRFLFFWHDKLYKQYIAFNAEHPVFAGKSFDDFAKLIQDRYGPAEMKMATMRTKDDVTLDHLEWPPSGDYTLWAIDQSSFYGNFCLKLSQTSVLAGLEAGRKEHRVAQGGHSAIIDAVTAPEQNKGDPNADIVDDILGHKTMRTNQGGGDDPAAPAPQPQQKKKTKKQTDDPLGDTAL